VWTSPERREAILDDFESSGMSGKAYARMHGIKYSTFAYWIQVRRRKRGDYERKQSGKQARQELALAEVVMASQPTNNSGLRVELPGGAVLVVKDAGQAAVAAELIRLVNKSR